MIYLSGATGGMSAEFILHHQIGLMLHPDNNTASLAENYPWWAADNGCFAAGDRFNHESWRLWLDTVPRSRCLFAVAPDVYCDAAATYERSTPILRCLRDQGFAAAFVAQNGAEYYSPPWDELDCLFIGGDTIWKLGRHVRVLAAEAKTRGKWVHMGRVNSEKRLRYATLIGCDSTDGTFLKFGPDKNRPRLASWSKQYLLPVRAT